MTETMAFGADTTLSERTETLLAEDFTQVRARTDRVFAGLMILQWLAGVLAALFISPRVWAGTNSTIHPHLWGALLLGGVVSGLPVALAILRPGKPYTAHAIAVGQMCTSALLIHLSGGRIETHFHVFCSLAVLAFYRDFRVLLTASIVIAVDHVVRGIFFPQSVYGVLTASPWRAMEHAAWVVFEDAVLFLAIRNNVRDMREKADQRARLEISRRTIEGEMLERTKDLRESEARFRTLSLTSPVGIFETDGHGRAVFTNPRWQQIFGLGLEEIDDDGWAAVIHDDDRQPIVDGWHAAASRGEPFDRQFRLTPVAGEDRWVHSRAVALTDESGTVTGFVGTVEDITRQKADEAELIRAREAALSTARLKSEFLANMSHEIRTPLNGVIGMTELTLETELSREQREYLETARTSADCLLSVIEDILDFSKIEAGKLELDPTETDLRQAVSTTLKTLALRAEKKGLELVSQIRPDVPGLVAIDAGRLRQVLLNLVGNALKFTAQGEVVVRIETESIADGVATLHLCVADTGIGIPPEKQASIFESFTQADMSTTRRFGGTGLGLAISARLVEMMGGRIWVESEPERGSRFHFTVRTMVVSLAPPANIDNTDSLGGLRVLVVDDNATNRLMLVEMLAQWGMSPTAVDDGYTALSRMSAARASGAAFDLVILDGHMPEMDGFDVARKIRESPDLAGATLMMLTSGGQVGDAARCRELGMSSYLIKPVSQADLVEAIRTALPRTGSSARSDVDGPSLRPEGHIGRAAATAKRRGLHVLVAEDNAVNQVVAVRLLEKLGHTSVVVENGVRVLQLLERESFDLVLMDVQMPVMGGYEATQAIREREAGSDRHLPVLGLTAHAMKSELEHCIEAGMDAVITKPVKVAELVDAIDRLFAPGEEEAEAAPVAEGEDHGLPRFDADQARENTGGDPTILAEIARIFRAEGPLQMEALRAGLSSHDASAVERAAHRLRGSLGTLGACRAAAIAGRIETHAEGADLKEAARATDLLESELAAVRNDLDGLVDPGLQDAA